MYEILPESEGKNLGVKAVGHISKDDEDKLVAMANKAIAEHGTINVLFDFTEFKSAEMAAEIEDFKWLEAHKNKIGKMAGVGNREYERLADELVNLIYPGENKYFDESRIEEAWQWLKG